jgi:hypothetical protein
MCSSIVLIDEDDSIDFNPLPFGRWNDPLTKIIHHHIPINYD